MSPRGSRAILYDSGEILIDQDEGIPESSVFGNAYSDGNAEVIHISQKVNYDESAKVRIACLCYSVAILLYIMYFSSFSYTNRNISPFS